MTDKTYYHYIHFYRGISILLIVAAHCWSMPIFMFNEELPLHLKPLFSFIETLFHGSTIFFALISGILFSLVLQDKPYKLFMKTKFKNVYLPFLVISLLYLLIWIAMDMVNPPEDLALWQLLAGFSFFLLTGHMSGHLWYIPVIMILFAITPLLNKLLISRQKIWFIIFLLLPLVVSRVWPNFHPGSVVYFIGPYLLGLYAGRNLVEIIDWISTRTSLLLITSVLLSMVYYVQLSNDIDYINWGIYAINSQETVTYIIRMSMALLLLKFFHDHIQTVPRLIDVLARYSFAIYFIHVAFVMLFIGVAKHLNMIPETPLVVFLFGLATFILSVLLSIAFTWLIKQFAGRYSRLLIGA